MGLPVWRPSSPDSSKHATERDPTASSRSAIRRRRIGDIGSSSSSSSSAPPPPRARRDTDNGLIESSRYHDYELHRLAEASRLRASELRVARQSLRRAPSNPPPAPTNIPPPPALSGPPPPPPRLSMYEQTQALRHQIFQLRETIQRHQAHDARLREHAAPWLEPDQQLHSDDPRAPHSALHALRSPLSALATLLQEVEYDFRDPIADDEEEQFRLTVRSQYVENPTANPHRYDRRFGWDEEMIENFWDEEHFRRLPSGDLIPSYQGAASPPPPRSPGFFSNRVVASPNPYVSVHGWDSPRRRESQRRFTQQLSRSTTPPGGPVASSGRLTRSIPEAPLDLVTVPGSIDGLGDRELSVGPTDEQWLVMQQTVAPDLTLPSADSSFTSAAASASFSASRSQSADSTAPTSYVDDDEWDSNCL